MRKHAIVPNHWIVPNTLVCACPALTTLQSVYLCLSTPNRVISEHPFSSPGLTHTIPKRYHLWRHFLISTKHGRIFSVPSSSFHWQIQWDEVARKYFYLLTLFLKKIHSALNSNQCQISSHSIVAEPSQLTQDYHITLQCSQHIIFACVASLLFTLIHRAE